MKKRLLSLLLCLAIIGTSVPVYGDGNAATGESTEQTTASVDTAGSTSDREVGYVLNGGSFISDYTAPSYYPTTSLPTLDEVTKTGYEFAGWYDNEELEGKAITSLDTSDHSGNVVLYAKWKDRYYYVDIPKSVDASSESFTVSAKAGGLYDGDYVEFTVDSENDWNLKSGNNTLAYELRDKETSVPWQEGTAVMSLSADKSSVEKEITANVLDTPQYTGNYTDQLTFDVTFTEASYTITYETNGGCIYVNEDDGSQAVVSYETYKAGTVLEDLPQPIKESCTFLGWCYDEGCTDYVDSRDRLLADTTLYASYVDMQQPEATVHDTFARAIDTEPTFTIQITDKSGSLSADQVRSACTITNVSDYTEEITLTCTQGADNIFTIGTSDEDGWKRGSSYKLTIDNDSLYFTGFDETVTEYDFTIYKDEITNLSLKNDIQYIKMKDLSNLVVNGKSVSEISISTITVGMDGSVVKDGADTTGSFSYSASTLYVGDMVAVYSGNVLPTLEVTSTEDNDVSFLLITEANGTNYSYRGAKTEEVLFIPEILPLDKKSDTDGDAENNSVTVPVSAMSFGSGEISENLGLDEDSEPNTGDYLAIYEDIKDSDSLVYGKITSVDLQNGEYIITYDVVSYEAVQIAMDLYKTENISGEDLIEGEDIEGLEAKVEEEAVSSGFVDEVASRIAEVAMQTESFAELQSELSDELDADISVYGDEAAIETFALPKVSIGEVKSELSTTLKHFDGELSGLHLGLEVEATLTFSMGKGKELQITVTATFEQEVRADINVDGEAIWKWWGIFPYIADYRVTASVDLYEYTGVALDVNFQLTRSGMDLWKKANEICDEMKGMIEAGQLMVSNISNLASIVSGDGGTITNTKDDIAVGKSLAQRYSEMLENEAEWVELYSVKLFNKTFTIYKIIDIEIQLRFTISTQINVSIGMSYWYKNAKRYVFCICIREQKATNDSIDLVKETYELDAWAMGVVGLRAGIQISIKVGLLSTSLVSVGLIARVGGYVKLWGYYYYQLKYTEGTGRSTRAMGAYYMDIGIYLQIVFEAQVLSGKVRFAPTLYEHEWPLYSVGYRDNVLDFNYTQESVKEISMKRVINSYQLPDDFFSMQYMDMRSGLDDGKYYTKVYEDNADNFTIVMSNDAFSYDPVENIILVDTTKGNYLDGEMTIVWNNRAGTFMTSPLKRTIKLHWDNLKYSSYYIEFVTNGGSYVPSIEARYGAEITAPSDPKRTGYTFTGWYRDETLTVPYEVPSTMPDVGVCVYAGWTPNVVSYTVINHVENENEVYEEEDPIVVKDDKRALADSVIQYTAPERANFTASYLKEVTIKPDGSTVIHNYYTRNKYTVTFVSDSEIVSSDTYKYGKYTPIPALYKPGYVFVGWDTEPGNTVTKDATYTAVWKAATDTPYTVKYYTQNANDQGYTLDEIKTYTGTTDTVQTAPEGTYDKKIYHLKDDTLPSDTIAPDGSMVLRVYYDLNTYTLTFDPCEGTLEEGKDKVTAVAGQTVSMPLPTRDGYLFDGWYLDEDYEEVFTGTMPTEDTTVYAKWSKKKVNYIVRHYYEKATSAKMELSEDNPDMGYDMVQEIYTAEIGSKVTPEYKLKTGFYALTEKSAVTVAEDGSTIVLYFYARYCYGFEIRYETSLGESVVQGGTDFLYGEKLVWDYLVERAGYKFLGLYLDKDFATPFTDTTMPDPADYGYEPAEEYSNNCLIVYAKYEAVEVPYKIVYKGQDLDGNYTVTLQPDVEGVAYTDTEISHEVPSFTGYTTPAKKSVDAAGDGSTVITYEYVRNHYKITYMDEDTKLAEESLYFGSEITYLPRKTNYAFTGYYTDSALTKEFTGTVPARDLILYAKYEANMVNYQILYKLQDINDKDTYKDVRTVNGSIAVLEGTLKPEVISYEGFTSPEAQTIQLSNEQDLYTVVYKYTRNTYSVTYKDGERELEKEELPFGAEITYTPTKDYYDFVGWYTDSALTKEFTGTVPSDALTLYAKWEAQEYYIRSEHFFENTVNEYFTIAGVSEIAKKTGEKVTAELLDAKDRVGFTPPAAVTFTLGDETTYPSGDVMYVDKGNHVIYIEYQYKRNCHDVIVKGCTEGETDKTKDEDLTFEDVKYGSTISVADIAKNMVGYTLKGLYLDEEMTREFTGVMPDEDLVLYTDWDPTMVNYQVVIHLSDTDEGKDQVYTMKALAGTKVVAGKDYQVDDIKYYKTAKSPEETLVKGDGTTKIVLNYERIRSTITLKGLEGGNKTLTGYYGASVEIPTPTKTGYSFAGWKDEKGNDYIPSTKETYPAENVTYTAQWTIMKFDLKIDLNGGTVSSDYTHGPTEYGASITKPSNPTRPGYYFICWQDKKGRNTYSIPDTMPAESLSYKAVWSLRGYGVHYYLDDGFVYGNNSGTITAESTFSLINPTKTGYTFTGWTTDGISTPTTALTIVNGIPCDDNKLKGNNISATGKTIKEITITANWTANTYFIKLLRGNDAGGDEMATIKATYDMTKYLPSCKYEKYGYSFAGWGLSDTDSRVVILNKSPVRNLTTKANGTVCLYAKWTPNTYKMTFDANGGKFSSGSSTKSYDVVYGKSVMVPANPTRKGYYLNGWKIKVGNTTNKVVSEGVVAYAWVQQTENSNVTYVADWKANNTFTYSSGDSTWYLDEDYHDFTWTIGENMGNIDYDSMSASYNTVKISVSAYAVVHDEGRAEIEAYYTTKSSPNNYKEVNGDSYRYAYAKTDRGFGTTYVYKAESGKNLDIKSLRIRISSNGSGPDCYTLKNVYITITFYKS